ncbi:MAG: alpha-2-macroglobulin family protein, partial [Bryobacteraceae bacterium]
YWAAHVETGASGRAQVKFEFPDALTAWRTTARAVTTATHAGSTVHKVIVRKNLMVRLATPRFFTQGDEVTVSVLTHNYLKSEKTARVSLDVEGLEVLSGTTRDVPIPSGGEVKAEWRVRAVGPAARLTGKALTDEESDAMEIALPVNPHGVRLVDAKAGSGNAEVDVAFPKEIVESTRSLEISVTPSVAGAIFGALEYLTSFPYGCTEQTMSSFLPNVLVSKALEELRVPSKVDPAELEKKIRAGLDRLYEFQHGDGGWGWWMNDESYPFMTAYVVAGLVQARGAGRRVHDDAIERGRKWLEAELARNRALSADQRAYMLMAAVSAGSKDRRLLDALWNERVRLSSYGVAVLGLAMHSAGDVRAGELASDLERLARADDAHAFWFVPNDPTLELNDSDASAETTAHALKLLARLRPASPLLYKAARWLVTHRDQGDHWSSTKQTAMVIYGLIDVLKASGELRPDFAVSVTVNGRQVFARRFAPADALAPESPAIRLNSAELLPSNKVQVKVTGTGRLYWSTQASYFSTEPKLSRTGPLALRISREYHKLAPVQQGGKVVHRLEPLASPLAPGDVVAVRLRLDGGGARYLLIEDPIPAGAEFIENDDLYRLEDKTLLRRYSWARREFRDDRAALFERYFERGPSDYMYLVKIVSAGTFRVSPARVQPMYQPQFLATTESRVLEVK